MCFVHQPRPCFIVPHSRGLPPTPMPFHSQEIMFCKFTQVTIARRDSVTHHVAHGKKFAGRPEERLRTARQSYSPFLEAFQDKRCSPWNQGFGMWIVLLVIRQPWMRKITTMGWNSRTDPDSQTPPGRESSTQPCETQ